MSRKIIQQALDALKDTHWSQKNVDAIAALEAELSKPEKYDQTTLELCDKCGWKTLIPDDCCLNCERNKFEQEPVAWSVLDKRTGRHWYTHESKYTAQYYSNLYSHRESDGSPSMVIIPLYAAPQKPDVTLISEGNINIS